MSKKNKNNRYDIIDTDTGEKVDAFSISGTYSGVTVHTQEQDEFNNVRKIIEHKNNGLPVILDEKYGAYVHSYFELQEPYLKAIQERYKGTYANKHIVRFLVLASFVTKNGYISINGNKQRKSGLKNIWELEKKAANAEFNMLCEIGYISIDKDNYIIVNQDIINKGKAHRSTTYTRIFSGTIQQLYYSTEPSKREQLAYVYRLIPYINRYHNIVCSNPIELDIEKVKRLDWNELAELCGYNKTHVKKFKDTLTHFRFRGQPLIGQFIVEDKITIIVNPAICFAGNNNKQLDYIKALFDME